MYIRLWLIHITSFNYLHVGSPNQEKLSSNFKRLLSFDPERIFKLGTALRSGLALKERKEAKES